MDIKKLEEFIEYSSRLKGYEKGEAQLFLDRFFQAFGHKGIIEAGGSLEYQIKKEGKTTFCDLIWPPKVLIEMKKKGEKLSKHYRQAKSYWDNAYGDRTEYVILCNFDEFWIYNWNLQAEPLDVVPIDKLIKMWRSLAFLCVEKEIKPIFGNNLVEVTKEAADKIAMLYKSLLNRGVKRHIAQRFTFQCLVSLFAEDTGLFPREGFFLDVINDCKKDQSSYDLFTLLFKKMNSKEPATGGRFRGIDYFDGGIFSEIYPLELNEAELDFLSDAAKYDWSKVQPSIFGNIFEDSIEDKERHATGAHFTYESDIMRIVEPTILKPWREKIAKAKTLTELNKIREDLSKYKVLDPACGSGNFLYVSFRELKHLEISILQKMLDKFHSTKPAKLHSVIKSSNFFGIDINPLGVELAKITLSMAKKFAADEFNRFTSQERLIEGRDKPLPFDNLDTNIICDDALFIDWPKVDAIIGNPPYQSKNKMQREFGRAYLNKLREQFPQMPGLADYCVYWFRKAHDNLLDGGRAGLVGTNTIRQTSSRKGGLDYIVENNGTITEAVSTMPWSGKAVVHVSIVNWLKGNKIKPEKRKLAIQYGEKKDGDWKEYELDYISSSLSQFYDVSKAKSLNVNSKSQSCYQGQTHGHKGFLLTLTEKKELLKKEPKAKEVIFPYLIAEEMIGKNDSQPSRFVIDFQPRDIFSAKRYKHTFKRIEEEVLPTRKKEYEKEKERNEKALSENLKAKINKHHENFFKRWWLLSYGRGELIKKLSGIKRYIACGQVTKRPIFEFVSSEIRPNAALMVFPLEDDFSFGILQSSLHWKWFNERCSTLKSDFRYTSKTVFDSFPWPQWEISGLTREPDKYKIDIALNIAIAARELRLIRNKIKEKNKLSLRDIYRTLDLPGDNELKKAHKKLDKAVWEAYYFGLPKKMQKKDELEFLFQLNELCSKKEKEGKEIYGPGLPSFCKNQKEFFSTDCIKLIQ